MVIEIGFIHEVWGTIEWRDGVYCYQKGDRLEALGEVVKEFTCRYPDLQGDALLEKMVEVLDSRVWAIQKD